MNPTIAAFHLRFAFLLTSALLLSAPGAWAQQGPQGQRLPPRIGYVYPAGGQKGSTIKVAVGGQYLGGTLDALFSCKGISASFLSYHRPLTQKEFNELREKIDELQKRKTAARKGGDSKEAAGWTDEDEKTLAALRMKAAEGRPNRQANPAISETAIIELTLSPDIKPGDYELRLQSPNGLSNPLVFCVGQLPELLSDSLRDGAPPLRRPGNQQAAVARTEMRIEIPSVVNGQILQGGVDRFRFAAKKGQKLVLAASARSLIPYIADAVPGWFQATLALYDAKGRELAYDDDFRFNPDPVLQYEIPADGDYVAEIKDSIFRGREDFVYRIAIGELPFVTGLFPLGGQAGSRTDVEVYGWNLSANKMPMDATGRAPGNLLLAVKKGDLSSNQTPFALGSDPEVMEAEANDSPEAAQSTTLSVVINGRIDRSDDKDHFRFTAKAGSEIVAEVVARRLGSPLDSQLRLSDSQGRQIAFNDDFEDKGSGLVTHHADSRVLAKIPADGTYFLELSDVQHQGGPAHSYRLHLRSPRPDFELRIVPSSINVRAAESVPLTVFALRKDGFAGEIRLRLPGVGQALSLDGAVIPAGQDRLRLTLSSRVIGTSKPYPLSIEGEADIAGGKVAHLAVPAEDMMQAFAYRHLVPSKDLLIEVLPKMPARPLMAVDIYDPIKLVPGGLTSFDVRVTTARRGIKGMLNQVMFELSEPPDGVKMEKTHHGLGVATIVLSCDAQKLKPGTRGNLIFTAYTEQERPADKEKGKAQGPRKIQLGYISAVPYVVPAK